jgi:transposase
VKKTYTASIKFKVALSALTGQPIADICKQYEVPASMVHKWKSQLKSRGSEVFNSSQKSRQQEGEKAETKLYEKIGKLTTELDFLKKVLND